MKAKYALFFLVLMALLVGGGIVYSRHLATIAENKKREAVVTSSVQFVSSTITVNGAVTAQNQAKLNFQIAGKLVYLPYKEGDSVLAGGVIAKLDTYQLQRQLSAALNNYQITRDTFDQNQDNSQNNVLKTQVKNNLLNENTSGLNEAVNQAIARIVDQNQMSLNNSVINVELANYALQLSTLTAPLNGVITHEDVNVAGVNITPATTFTIVDPKTMVFRANVPMEDIYYVSEGSAVSLVIDGVPNKIEGKVVKIYPSKVVLASGQAVYQVDVASPDLLSQTKLDETGTAIISTNSENVALVPAWTVLSGKYIWVDDGGIPKLKQIRVGKIHEDKVEVTGGLSTRDKIIIDPEYISSLKYKLL